MATEITIPATSRSHTSEAHVTVGGLSNLAIIILLCASLLSVALSFYSLGAVRAADARAQNAIERAGLSERESRIMTAEVQYIRAWAGAQGIRIPIDHEDAESVALSHHPANAKLVQHRHAR